MINIPMDELDHALERYREARSMDVKHAEDWFKKIQVGAAPTREEFEKFQSDGEALRERVKNAWDEYCGIAKNRSFDRKTGEIWTYPKTMRPSISLRRGSNC